METIRKTINIEDFTSREHSLIPFIKGGENNDIVISKYEDIIRDDGDGRDGNWGKISCDIELNDDEKKNAKRFGYGKGYGDKYIVSFKELSEKYHFFKHILQNTTFYRKRIGKNGVVKWVEIDIVLHRKMDDKIKIYPSFEEIPSEEEMVGIYTDNSFYNDEFWVMFQFLMRAMGVFVIDEKCIKQDNGVPEIMHYTSIKYYLDRMLAIKNDDDCCEHNIYNFLGGDEFYSFLEDKYCEIESEYNYWFGKIVMLEEENEEEEKKVKAPNITIDIALNASYENIGIYSLIPYDINAAPQDEQGIEGLNTQGGEDEETELKPCRMESKLQSLKRTQRTYGEKRESQDVWKECLLPSIIEITSNENGDAEYKSLNFYSISIAFNKTYDKTQDCYYGDMLFDIVLDEENGIATLKYIIGTKLEKTDEGWEIVDKINGKTMNDFFGGDISDYISGDKKINKFSGVVFIEQRPFERLNYSELSDYHLIILDGNNPVNVLSSIKEDVIVIDDEDILMSDCYFTENLEEEYSEGHLIMTDSQFGKFQTEVSNIEELVIDRGYISMFEMHYKMGEINTLEDMENYSNNIFGL